MTREELNEQKQKELVREENKEKTKKVIKVSLKYFFIILIISLLFFFYTTYCSTTHVIVKEERIINSKIPKSFNGAKIIQFSDLHYGSTMYYEDVLKVVDLINERKPDLVVFTGDLIDQNYELKSKEQEKLIKALKNIDASLGKYAIIGEEDGENFVTIFNQSDFTILNNSYDLIYMNDKNPILLTGTSSLLKENYDLTKTYSYFNEPTHNSNIFTISLVHEPDLVSEIKESYNVDLYLAGHSHNGHIRIPYFGSVTKKEGAKEFDQPYYYFDNSQLYISSGLGTNGVGMRLFCRPSIYFFRLSQD